MSKKLLLFTLAPVLLFGGTTFFTNTTSHADKALDFINSLSSEQRKIALFSLDDGGRYHWTYLPPSMVGSKGLAMKNLDEYQKTKLNTLLQSYLSTKGYTKANAIMSLEEILKQLQPENPHRIPENYFITIYGTPHKDNVWAWRFEGHHLSLNFTVVKNQIAFAPFFFGSNPAEVKEGDKKGFRAITDEEDIGLELINSFTDKQKQKAIFSVRTFTDIVSASASEVTPLPPVGIAAKEMTYEQKQLLRKLLDAFLSCMPEELAHKRTTNIMAENIDVIQFGWAGTLKKGEPHYYRVQGKSFLFEFDNTQNNANHIHTVWRDFNGDFGRDLLKEHYKTGHHHQDDMKKSGENSNRFD